MAYSSSCSAITSCRPRWRNLCDSWHRSILLSLLLRDITSFPLGPGAGDGGRQLQPGDPGVVGTAAARKAVGVHADQEGQRGVAAHAASRHADQQRWRLSEHVPREVHQGLQRREGDDEGRQQERDGEGRQRSSGEGAFV